MTMAAQAIKASIAYHLERPQASWAEHADHLRSIDLGFAVDSDSDCCVFADGSATDPDLETAFPSLEAATRCEACEAERANPYGARACGDCESGPSDEELVDAAYPLLPGHMAPGE